MKCLYYKCYEEVVYWVQIIIVLACSSTRDKFEWHIYSKQFIALLSSHLPFLLRVLYCLYQSEHSIDLSRAWLCCTMWLNYLIYFAMFHVHLLDFLSICHCQKVKWIEWWDWILYTASSLPIYKWKANHILYKSCFSSKKKKTLNL